MGGLCGVAGGGGERGGAEGGLRGRGGGMPPPPNVCVKMYLSQHRRPALENNHIDSIQ